VSTTATTPPRTAAALASRRRDSRAALDRVHTAIAHLQRQHTLVTVAAVARHARVSRTFLYTNPDARTALDTTKHQATQHRPDTGRTGDPREASWRERALNAEAALKNANTEIIAQRDRIAELLGRTRDLEAEWTDESLARITSENTSLKQRVRQLTTDNRTLDERLTAARSNLRFHDRRIAELEAQLAEHNTRR
jgi:hypothetical protein